MAKDRVEKEVEKLKLLKSASPLEALPVVRKALTDKVNLVVKTAADICSHHVLTGLTSDLKKAFDRFFDQDKDPQCWAKNSLSKALKIVGVQESTVFLRGVRYVQWEPVWGGQEDSAAGLRGTCLLALAQCTDITRDEIFRHVVDGLADRDLSVRQDAVQALEHLEGREALLLLRLKARVGDGDVRVTGQALEAILRLEGVSALAFVGEFLDNPDPDLAGEAALAMGASRFPEALRLLQQSFEKGGKTGFSTVALRGISVSRLDEALDFLLTVIVKDRFDRNAEDAVTALALHQGSAEIVRRVEAAVKERGGERLWKEFRRAFSRE